MGFFKKIGKSIKKNVSFKNFAKIATPALGVIPGFGGVLQSTAQNLQDQAQAKRDQRAYDAEILRQQNNHDINQVTKVVTSSAVEMLGGAVIDGAIDGMNQGTKKALSKGGSSLIDMSIKEWFSQHWKQLAIAILTLGIAIYFIRKNAKKQPVKRSYR
ncbi:hypothetical protein [Flavobacterium crassostreae]|uniref:Uncharacterized protein n=1 Tax=Flavobacterium crassostreae TaxID=1763534 RepID=A0A1B9EA99_9FLAO|nr:hypothetical protein [Flavobacterium crassostreae]OCB78821.1 hypothetical protein LPBF_00080 [Flavobacterium crassostreae]